MSSQSAVASKEGDAGVSGDLFALDRAVDLSTDDGITDPWEEYQKFKVSVPFFRMLNLY